MAMASCSPLLQYSQAHQQFQLDSPHSVVRVTAPPPLPYLPARLSTLYGEGTLLAQGSMAPPLTQTLLIPPGTIPLCAV